MADIRRLLGRLIALEEDSLVDMLQFEKKQFVSIETFRKTGVGVRTPIWFAECDQEFLLWTDVNSGKVKRITNNSKVMVAPCSRFGEITGEWVHAEASIDERPEAVEQVETLLRRKVGLGFAIFRFIDGARDRRKGGRRVCIRVSFSPATDQK